MPEDNTLAISFRNILDLKEQNRLSELEFKTFLNWCHMCEAASDATVVIINRGFYNLKKGLAYFACKKQHLFFIVGNWYIYIGVFIAAS